jgi:hypothetical protein
MERYILILSEVEMFVLGAQIYCMTRTALQISTRHPLATRGVKILTATIEM